MRRRTATGWRRWALGAGSGLILCVATGIGATAIAHASALSRGGSAPGSAVLANGFLNMPSTVPSLLSPILPSLPVPTSSLPVVGGGPTPCALNCPTNPTPPGGGNHTSSGPSDPATIAAAPSATATPAAVLGGGLFGGPRGTPPSGLNIGPPPSVLALGPVSPVGLGSAPFLWPLFAALDALGLVAVVTVVRKTWSRSAAD